MFGLLSKLINLFKVFSIRSSNNKDNSPTGGNNQKKPMKNGITICIDPGHGGADPGAMHPTDNPVYIESHLALEISEHLGYLLYEAGYEVITTRADNDSPITRSDRIRRIKQSKADLLVSIHCNSFHKPAYGMETLYNSSNQQSMWLAKYIQTELKKDFPGHKDRGIKVRNNLYVLKQLSPSALVEVEFINTAGEFIQDNVEELAESIFNGIETFIDS